MRIGKPHAGCLEGVARVVAGDEGGCACRRLLGGGGRIDTQ